MNKLIIPPSCNWFSSKILACAVDNTIIYGSRNDVVVIYPEPSNESTDIKILGGLHTSRVVSVAVNRNWGNPNKWAVSVGEDNVIQLLDISTCTAKISHVGHKTHQDKVIAAEFAGEDRVVSISEKGLIIIWKLSNSDLSSVNAIKESNVRVSTMSICPHATWLMAIGTRKGCILITDLRKSGRVLFKIRAHSEEILSLSWCPAPHNVFPQKKIVFKSRNNDDKKQEKERSEDTSLLDVVPELESTDLSDKVDETPKTSNGSQDVVQEAENKAEEQVVNLDIRNYSSTETLTEEMIDIKASESQKNDETIEITEPIEENIEKDEDAIKPIIRQEFLLASSARASKSIKIWRAGTDGLLETVLVFPKTYSSRSKGGSDKSWITTCWVTPRSLLSSANKAQLLHWRLGEDGKNNDKEYVPRLIHSDHTKQLFCIAAPIRKHESADDEDWKDKNLMNAWSVGSERFILNTSLGCDRETLGNYTTIGGMITCLSSSPIDPTRYGIFLKFIFLLNSVYRIVCGMGDSARMIDLTRPHKQTLSMMPLYDKHQLKITSFAWHPTKESCLAYGTQEGQVGLIDISTTSKNVIELVRSSHEHIYRLQWAPMKGTEKLLLYTILNSHLVAYNTKKPLNAPTKIHLNNDIGLTSFCWKDDYSILAVATKECEILLYNNKFKLIGSFILQSKLVRCMEWHPLGTPEENWLAVATNQVIVYDCSLDNLNARNKYQEYVVAILSGHAGLVHSLSWSPHQSELLASAGDVGIALVWNVKTKTLLHACVSQHDVFYTVLWSPLDSDYLMTGGRSCVLKIWKLSETSATYTIDKAQEKQISPSEKSQNDEEIPVVKVVGKQKRNVKCLLNGIAQKHNLRMHYDMLEDCIKLFNSKYNQQYQNAYKDENISNDGREPSVFNILDLFDGKAGIDEILKLELETHANRTTPLCLESISLWQCNIGDTIKNAIKCGSLNHWLISIAPMVSYNLWQEACEAYAKQLLDDSNNRPIEAAYFFLGCHKVEEAVEALCFGNYHREAFILAKTRLSSTDPIINNILKKWAVYATAVGKFELAAQCYIALDMLEDAAKVLFRRTDVPILEFCVKLAEQTDNEGLIHATKFRLNAFKSDIVKQPNNSLSLKPRIELELQNQSEPDKQCDNSKMQLQDQVEVELQKNEEKNYLENFEMFLKSEVDAELQKDEGQNGLENSEVLLKSEVDVELQKDEGRNGLENPEMLLKSEVDLELQKDEEEESALESERGTIIVINTPTTST
ncbi:hypothetical protein FQR65_LT04903 [Abscondita terminalis]|nr:hypothetical protein FQR65_LT04903 [Abscondita terminalis]